MNVSDVNLDWIGNIPKNWDVKKIKHLFKISKERSESNNENNVLSLTFNGIISRDISENEGQLPETFKGYSIINIDDIVMNPMDLKSGWVDKSKYNGIISPSYYVLRPISNSIDLDYFTYQLQKHYEEKIFFEFGQGVSYDFRWGMGKDTLLNFPLICPPLIEQKKISLFLNKKNKLIEKLINKIEQKIILLKEKKNSLINECVTQGLNPRTEMKESGINWIGKIPNNWNIKRIADLGNFSKAKNISKDDLKKTGHPCMLYTEIYTEYDRVVTKTVSYINHELFECSTKISKGNFLFTSSGETVEEIGKCVLFDGDKNISIGGDMTVFKLHEQNNIEPEFLSFVFNSAYCQYFKSFNSRGEIVVHVYEKQLRDMKIAIPPLEEQHKILNFLKKKEKSINSLIRLESQKIKLLKEYQTSLISNIINSKFSIQKENDNDLY